MGAGPPQPVAPVSRQPPNCGTLARRGCACGCLGTVVALAALALLVGSTNHMWERRVEAKLKQLRTAGEPLTNAELAPPPVSAKDNAAPLYLKAAELLKPHEGDYLTAPHTLGYDCISWWNDREVDAVVGLAGQDERVARLVRQATRRPACRLDGLWQKRLVDALPQGSKLRLVARFEAAAALGAARRGDRAEALERLIDGFVVSRRLAEEVPLRGLTGTASAESALMWPAQYIVAHGSLPDLSARRLAEELGWLDCRRVATRQVQAWRVLGLELADDLRSGNLSAGARGVFPRQGITPPGPPMDEPFVYVYGRLLRRFLCQDELRYLSFMDRGEAMVSKPYPAVASSAGALRKEIAALRAWQLLGTRLSLVEYASWPADAQKARARRALLQVALGLEVYRQRHGRYPGTLPDLRSIRWPTPEDPFTGKPLVYRRQGARYLLYSIGVDLKDDGGRPVYTLVRDPALSKRLPQVGRDDGDLVWLPWR
jgi:hypothetical protein